MCSSTISLIRQTSQRCLDSVLIFNALIGLHTAAIFVYCHCDDDENDLVRAPHRQSWYFSGVIRHYVKFWQTGHENEHDYKQAKFFYSLRGNTDQWSLTLL